MLRPDTKAFKADWFCKALDRASAETPGSPINFAPTKYDSTNTNNEIANITNKLPNVGKKYSPTPDTNSFKSVFL